MRWPLRNQILLPFAGTMLAVVAIVSSLDAYLSARRSQQQIEEQLGELASTLEQANFPLTDAVLKQARGLSGADMVVTSAAGVPLAASRADVAVSSLTGRPPSPTIRLDHPLSLSDGEYLQAAIPLAAHSPDSGQRVLYLLYPRADLRLARWQAASPSLLVGALALVLVAVLATVIAARLSRPISGLREQFGRLVQGDFQPMAIPDRNDEISDLVRSANCLAEQLEEMQRVIKRTERLSLLGQLSGGLAHQLRNSVTGARIAVQLHQRCCEHHDTESLEVALRQLSLTESHLQKFLSVGRPAAPNQTVCDLWQVVEDVAALVAPACKHQRVTLEIPARAGGPTQLSADEDQLHQMLMNLVINGIEAAAPGGWVRIQLDFTPEDLYLQVSDSGQGPGLDIRQRLFEPFVTGKPEGIGLGLTVVRQIVTAHGGTISLLSGPPTLFQVILPRGVLPASAGRPLAIANAMNEQIGSQP